MKFLIKLLLYTLSASVFMSTNGVLIATESATKFRKPLSSHVKEESDVYKCVSYNIDQNIKIASDTYGENYWALKAIMDKDNPFYGSIKVLKQIIALVEQYKMRTDGAGINAVNPSTWFGNYCSKYIFVKDVSDIEKDNPTSKSLDAPCIKNIFAQINFVSVLFGVYHSSIEDQWSLDEVWKSVLKHVTNELNSTELSSGVSLYEYLLSKFNHDKEKFETYIKHDWLCYLKQFNVLINTERHDKHDDSVLAKLTLLFDSNIRIFLPNDQKFIKFFNLEQTAQYFYKDKIYKNQVDNEEKPLLLKNFHQDVICTKDFVSYYNSVLLDHGLHKDIYKCDINDYNFDYVFMLKAFKDYNYEQSKLSDEQKKHDPKGYTTLADEAIFFTKRLILDKISLPSEYNRYINPKAILKILYDLKISSTRNEILTVLYQVFKMFSNLQLTDFNLNHIEFITQQLLSSKNKSIIDLTNHVKQLITKSKTTDFSKFYDEIEKYFL